MGLFSTITGLASKIGGFAGSLTGALGSFGQLGSLSSLISLPAAVQPRPPTASFVSAPVAVGPTPVAFQTPTAELRRRTVAVAPMGVVGGLAAGTARVLGAVGSGITRMVAPTLIKIAQATGRRSMTLRQAVKIIRRTGTFLGPAAAAAALGITVAEMAELIFVDASRPRRRMNPANISALRRSMRRIQSFHRLCMKADTLRGRGGRRRRTSLSPHTTSIVQAR